MFCKTSPIHHSSILEPVQLKKLLDVGMQKENRFLGVRKSRPIVVILWKKSNRTLGCILDPTCKLGWLIICGSFSYQGTNVVYVKNLHSLKVRLTAQASTDNLDYPLSRNQAAAFARIAGRFVKIPVLTTAVACVQDDAGCQRHCLLPTTCFCSRPQK